MVRPLADIVGGNATVQIAAGSAHQCQWIQFIVSGSGTVRLGDATVTATLGLPIPAGGGQLFPYKGTLNFYPLAGLYAYIPSGATLSVLYDA